MPETELINLRNLGKTSVQWLRAIGIHDAAELRRRGPVAAYSAVRARGFRASRTLLFAIAGALQDIHWSKLDPDYKQQLLQQLDEHDRRE